jgi:diadenylate cyclase
VYQLPIGFRFPVDVVDILLVAFLIYRILLLIKGTRAFQVLLGMILIVAAFVGSRQLGLVTLNWILDSFLSSFILVVVILFQSDIRRALAQMGKHRFWGMTHGLPITIDVVEELVRAAAGLANKRIGAIIVVERETRLMDHMEGGVLLDARVSRELIHSIFLPYSPIHDGAVTVGNQRILWAGSFLPLTTRTDIDKDLGTRHRAAMGITEETDAVAIVVSEERSAMSLVINGRITRDLDTKTLRKVLTRLLEVKVRRRKQKVYSKTPTAENIP